MVKMHCVFLLYEVPLVEVCYNNYHGSKTTPDDKQNKRVKEGLDNGCTTSLPLQSTAQSKPHKRKIAVEVLRMQSRS